MRSYPALMELAGGLYKFHQLGTVKFEEVWRGNPKEILGEESFNIFFLFINEHLLKFFREEGEDVVGWS